MNRSNSASQILQVLGMLMMLSASITLSGASHAKPCTGTDCPNKTPPSTKSTKSVVKPTPGNSVHQPLPVEPPQVRPPKDESGTIFDDWNLMGIVRNHNKNYPINSDEDSDYGHKDRVLSAFVGLFNRLEATTTNIERERDTGDLFVPRLNKQAFERYPVVVGHMNVDPKKIPVLAIRFKVKQERYDENGKKFTVTCGEGVQGFDGVFQVTVGDTAGLGAWGWKTAHSLNVFPNRANAADLLTNCLKKNEGGWLNLAGSNKYNTIFSDEHVPVLSKEGVLVSNLATGNFLLRQAETILALVRDREVGVYMYEDMEDPYTLELDMTPEKHQQFIQALAENKLNRTKNPIAIEQIDFADYFMPTNWKW